MWNTSEQKLDMTNEKNLVCVKTRVYPSMSPFGFWLKSRSYVCFIRLAFSRMIIYLLSLLRVIKKHFAWYMYAWYVTRRGCLDPVPLLCLLFLFVFVNFKLLTSAVLFIGKITAARQVTEISDTSVQIGISWRNSPHWMLLLFLQLYPSMSLLAFFVSLSRFCCKYFSWIFLWVAVHYKIA